MAFDETKGFVLLMEMRWTMTDKMDYNSIF